MKRIILIVVIVKVVLFLFYLSTKKKDTSEEKESVDIDYEKLSNQLINISALENCKAEYPFASWRLNAIEHGMKQYSEVNCEATEMIFDQLIADLKLLPNDVTVKDKVLLFKYAVLSLNILNEKVDDLIETGEREDLCELMDLITVAAGLDPEEFADGEGIASEWREW